MLTSDSKMPFGKYRNKQLKVLRESYLIDFYKNHFDKYDSLDKNKQEFIVYILGVVGAKLLNTISESFREKSEFNKIINEFCPKEFFITESDAKYRLNHIRKMSENGKLKRHSVKIPTRVYKCNKCPYWHLTSADFKVDGIVKEFNNSEIEEEVFELILKDKWLKLMQE